jgi:hypothetical protein
LILRYSGAHPGRGEGVGEAAGMHPTTKIEIKKNAYFVDTIILNVVRDLSYSQNQPLKSAGEQQVYIVILKYRTRN